MELLLSNELDRDEIELLIGVYRLQFEASFPKIDVLYTAFMKNWEQDTIDYLYSNRDAFKLEDADFENISEHFEYYGFKVPSFEDIHRWLDILQLVYMTDAGDVIHSPLVSIW